MTPLVISISLDTLASWLDDNGTAYVIVRDPKGAWRIDLDGYSGRVDFDTPLPLVRLDMVALIERMQE